MAPSEGTYWAFPMLSRQCHAQAGANVGCYHLTNTTWSFAANVTSELFKRWCQKAVGMKVCVWLARSFLSSEFHSPFSHLCVVGGREERGGPCTSLWSLFSGWSLSRQVWWKLSDLVPSTAVVTRGTETCFSKMKWQPTEYSKIPARQDIGYILVKWVIRKELLPFVKDLLRARR